MNSKNTWLLLALAAGLLGFIVAYQKFVLLPQSQPHLVVPGLKPAAITTIQIRISGQPELLALRTNGGWQLTKPVPGPARPEAIEHFLATLATLKPDAFLAARELADHPSAETDFGFDAPLATVMLFSGSSRRQVIVGSRTAPGDQAYVEVVGLPGVSLVSTNLINAIPQTSAAWRDTALLNWNTLKFDHLLVNNGPRALELKRDPTNQLWQLVRQKARADNLLLDELFRRLHTVRITDFVTDDPRADLDAYGLQTPELEMTFTLGTNHATTLAFGKSPTNNPAVIFARVGGSDSVFTVPSEPFLPWHAAPADFRDHLLVSFRMLPDSIAVVGEDQFTLIRQTNNLWRIEPPTLPVDTNYMMHVIFTFLQMQIVKYEKDVVTEPDLPDYGLAPPRQQYTFNFGGTNAAQVQVQFGSNVEDRVYARRSDEATVYAVRHADFLNLPAASWEMRERRVWNFTEHNVARVVIEQGGRKRELVRNGTNSWSVAPGSMGVIKDVFGLEEAVHRTGDLSAAFWSGRGQIDRAKFGFPEQPHRLTFELKDGTTHTIEFGGEAPSHYPYALVTLDGEAWVMEFPWATWQFVENYLGIPVREL